MVLFDEIFVNNLFIFSVSILTSVASKNYNALLCNHMEPKIEKILKKNQNSFWKNWSTTSQILTIHQILEGVRTKNLKAKLLLVDFSKAFDSIHRGKMEQILLTYGQPKETIAAIMMLYKNTKVKVRPQNGDVDYFDIAAGVLQGDILAPYLLFICLVYVLRTSIDLMKENGFKILCTNNYRCGLRRWHSAPGKFTRPSRIPAT